MSLQGYFHPRDTVQDLYEWVNSCLKDGVEKDNISSEQWPFELYTSPPRTVLSPCSGNTANNSNKGNKSDPSAREALTLSSMGFVPAAVIYLAWKNNPKAFSTSTTTVDVGSYFLPALLEAAVSEDKSASIPIGKLFCICDISSKHAYRWVYHH